MSPPQVSFIILNWNVRDLLRDCLVSAFAQTGFTREVIVVDSASTDGSAEMVRGEFPEVTLLVSRENLGYSKGNNWGLRESHGEFLFVLNPDTVLRPGAVGSLLSYLGANPEVGLCGPRLISADGSTQSSRRRWPTFWTGLFESTWLQPLAPPGLLGRYYALDLPDDRPAWVDWVTGAALFLRREVYRQVGGLDEGFFMYSEELDWCRRIQGASWKVAYVPSAVVVHLQGKSSERAVAAETQLRFQRSKLRYFRKVHGPLEAGVLRVFLLLLYAQQLVLESAKLAVGHRPGLRRKRIAAYWEVLKSRLREG